MPVLRRFAFVTLALALAAPLALSAQDGQAQTSPDNGTQGPRGPGTRGQGRMGRGIRGEVLSVAGSNLSIKTDSGETWTVVTTDNTRTMIDRQPVKLAEIKAGYQVMAAGIVDQDKHEIHALMVAGITAAEAAKLKADLGKTYILGKITAINDTKLTIERPDKVAQTIVLDESTSIKRGGRLPAELNGGGLFNGGGFGGGGGRGPRTPADAPNNATTGGVPPGMEGEAITLADIKVGDTIAATGSLQSGAFVPTDLHVLVRPQRPPRPADGTAPQPAAQN